MAERYAGLCFGKEMFFHDPRAAELSIKLYNLAPLDEINHKKLKKLLDAFDEFDLTQLHMLTTCLADVADNHCKDCADDAEQSEKRIELIQLAKLYHSTSKLITTELHRKHAQHTSSQSTLRSFLL